MMILPITGNIIIVFNNIVNNRGSQNLDTVYPKVENVTEKYFLGPHKVVTTSNGS
jgi:hypothetical protein